MNMNKDKNLKIIQLYKN